MSQKIAMLQPGQAFLNFNKLNPAQVDTLKCLALLAMIIDHVNMLVMPDTDVLMAGIGRMAMPLFTLIFAFNIARQPQRSQEFATRQWLWALAIQPFFAAAFVDHYPWYGLNIIFVFATCCQILTWTRSGGKYAHIKSLLLLTVMAYPLSIASYGIAGVIFVLATVFLFTDDMSNKMMVVVWLVFYAMLNISVGSLSSLNYVILFLTLPSFLLPYIAVSLVEMQPLSGRRFLPRQAFYWFYLLHLLGLAVIIHFMA